MGFEVWKALLGLRRFALLCMYSSGKPKTNRTNKKYLKYLQTNKLNTPQTTQKGNIFQYIRSSAKNLKSFTRNYWYIVLPLHGILTVSYITMFYMISRKQTLLAHLKWFEYTEKDMKMPKTVKYLPDMSKKTIEDIAVTVILMKLSAPIRYTTTFIGSKVFVDFLKRQNLVNLLLVQNVSK